MNHPFQKTASSKVFLSTFILQEFLRPSTVVERKARKKLEIALTWVQHTWRSWQPALPFMKAHQLRNRLVQLLGLHSGAAYQSYNPPAYLLKAGRYVQNIIFRLDRLPQNAKLIFVPSLMFEYLGRHAHQNLYLLMLHEFSLNVYSSN